MRSDNYQKLHYNKRWFSLIANQNLRDRFPWHQYRVHQRLFPRTATKNTRHEQKLRDNLMTNNIVKVHKYSDWNYRKTPVKKKNQKSYKNTRPHQKNVKYDENVWNTNWYLLHSLVTEKSELYKKFTALSEIM